ncbi:MAG: FkbM family methyltransferase [Erythrobacter sp.]
MSLRDAVARALNRKGANPEQEAYARLAARGFTPCSIVDVGAYVGNWTRMIKQIYPDAQVLMCEAQPDKLTKLEEVRKELGGVEIVSGLMGSEAGQEVRFYEMETGSSMFPENSDVDRCERLLITKTLDDVTVAMPAPSLLKVDVQGAELEVLGGAARFLDQCEFVQLEVALLDYNEGAPSFLEVLTFMDQRGFVPFDIAGASRPNGLDLVQIDLLFARAASTLRPSSFRFSDSGS